MSDFKLSTALKAISARAAEQQHEQEALSTIGRGSIDPDSPGERIARARQYEADCYAQLKYLQDEPNSELKTQRINNIMDRLGELAGEQGDHARAATISKSPERREYYRRIVKAIKIADNKECKCDPDLIVDRANGVEFQSKAIMTVDQIVSKDGQTLNLDVCRKCGFSNAR